MARISSWCRVDAHDVCTASLIDQSGKPFRCNCPCHPTVEQLQEPEEEPEEEDEDY